jgi:hypothetical protein
MIPKVSLSKGEFVHIGNIGVDAGMCWLGDPCYIFHKEKDEVPEIGKSWENFCDIIEKSNFYKTRTIEFNNGLGVLTSTGVGDGVYPVYAIKYNREIAGVFVDFYGLIEYDNDAEDDEAEDDEVENNEKSNFVPHPSDYGYYEDEIYPEEYHWEPDELEPMDY